MREIKFRAWSADTDEMIPWEEAMFPEWFEDSDMHVMQFTGIQDKNFVDIYEGDIVEDKAKRNMIVEYRELKASFFFSWVKDRNQGAFYEDLLSCHKPIEVIGNIHETPELLKETHE